MAEESLSALRRYLTDPRVVGMVTGGPLAIMNAIARQQGGSKFFPGERVSGVHPAARQVEEAKD